jgi:membrane protease YdiL (CAAX protease family)
VKPSTRVVLLAIAFEGALGLLGWALAAWQDVPLAPRLTPASDMWLRTAVAVLPMLAALAYVTRSRWKPIVDLRTRVEALVGELFRDASWLGLAVISLAAGVGEEVLFRGALQPIAERWWGPLAGLAAGSVLFGAAHALTRTYFIFAVIVGAYLGWLAQHYGELFTPILVHAVYDFAALLVLKSRTAGHASVSERPESAASNSMRNLKETP